jgi:hypothetical protein
LLRVGLAPICAPRSLDLLRKNRECLTELGELGATPQCQSSLVAIAQAVNFMLQGIHGEAHLCRAFYLVRDTFECGRAVAQRRCAREVVDEIDHLQKEVLSPKKLI